MPAAALRLVAEQVRSFRKARNRQNLSFLFVFWKNYVTLRVFFPRGNITTAGDLKEAVDACGKGGYRLVLIDTPPHVEAPCREATHLSDLVVIPCGPTAPDVEAIGATIHILRETKTPGIIVLNQGRPGSNINEKAIAVLKQYGLPVCTVPIMRRAALADALTDGRAVVELEQTGKAASEITRSMVTDDALRCAPLGHCLAEHLAQPREVLPVEAARPHNGPAVAVEDQDTVEPLAIDFDEVPQIGKPDLMWDSGLLRPFVRVEWALRAQGGCKQHF